MGEGGEDAFCLANSILLRLLHHIQQHRVIGERDIHEAVWVDDLRDTPRIRHRLLPAPRRGWSGVELISEMMARDWPRVSPRHRALPARLLIRRGSLCTPWR